MKIIKILPGDVLHLKKPHPCGSFEFSVLRIGSDIRIKCNGCSRDMNVPREKLEKKIKYINNEPV
jgi:hypothetical protein